MRISVALCTYNWSLYLAEQLASIAQQTRLPDEVVICDDGSTTEHSRSLKLSPTARHFLFLFFRTIRISALQKTLRKQFASQRGHHCFM